MSEQNKRISLATAKTWTAEYRSRQSGQTKAFLIPIEDLEGVLNEIKGQTGEPCARAYMGIDPSNGEEKLILIGTTQEKDRNGDVVYRDMLPTEEESDEGPGPGIYDFTRPCPPYCDPNSPLN